MCQQIINHLAQKHNGQDTLEGILLSLYPDHMDTFSEEILKTLRELLDLGKLTVVKSDDGKAHFKLDEQNPPLAQGNSE